MSHCKCTHAYTCKACRAPEKATYQEIADEIGITHQAVWEIERRALKKARVLLELLDITEKDIA